MAKPETEAKQFQDVDKINAFAELFNILVNEMNNGLYDRQKVIKVCKLWEQIP